jgi:hypothetical protein
MGPDRSPLGCIFMELTVRRPGPLAARLQTQVTHSSQAQLLTHVTHFSQTRTAGLLAAYSGNPFSSAPVAYLCKPFSLCPERWPPRCILGNPLFPGPDPRPPGCILRLLILPTPRSLATRLHTQATHSSQTQIPGLPAAYSGNKLFPRP